MDGAWRDLELDGARLHFHRRTGINVLQRGEATAALERRAPRLLQVGLLTECNLSCGFCYRDRRAPSLLTAPFLAEILRRASEWGVLQAAFGGGEPLMFPGFLDLLDELSGDTPLALSVTTNGTLVTEDVARRLRRIPGEVRVSAYENNGYRSVLGRLRGGDVGVNWLLTPANVRLVEPYVHDFLWSGARNVLLLGYKGSDPALHLGVAELELLRSSLRRLEGLPIRLDVCWYPMLADLPHLFGRTDCDAGDDFLVITPDRAVQACSFQQERIPFETFADLVRIYRELRRRRPAASVRGCTRELFRELPRRPTESGTFVWRAWASNNSGDYTILARFRTPEEAAESAASLRELARAHESFLASPAGRAWLEEHDHAGSTPTPPMQLFGARHGISWTEDGDGLWWEEDGFGAPVLTAGSIGSDVIVYHPYCMGLPEEAFRRYFAAVGALGMGHWSYERPLVKVTARSGSEAALAALREHMRVVREAEYASDVEEPPPWGAEVVDPRLADDEDRGARLDGVHEDLHVGSSGVTFTISFANTFAGCLALERWLRSEGFTDTEIQLSGATEALPEGPRVRPLRGILGDTRPLSERIAGASVGDLVTLAFDHFSVPDAIRRKLGQARDGMEPDELVAMCQARWEELLTSGVDTTVAARQLVIDLFGPRARDWARAIWRHQRKTSIVAGDLALIGCALPRDEARELATAWYRESADRKQQSVRLPMLGQLHDPRVLDLVEEWWRDRRSSDSVTSDWGEMAASSRISWSTIVHWIQGGRPLSLIALDALWRYRHRGIPANSEGSEGFVPPTLQELTALLDACRFSDTSLGVTRLVAKILSAPGNLVRSERSDAT